METFEVAVYATDWRNGAKPSRIVKVTAHNGSEATKLVIDKLDRDGCRWWVGLQARLVEVR